MVPAWARGAVFTAIVWLCLTCAGSAQTLTFPALSGRVVDEAGLLDATDRAALTDALAGLEAKTTDQLVVVTLKSLQGTTIEDYGYQLGRRWQIGQKDKDTGVLLIVAATERRVRIEVGYGLEGTLTDGLTKVIIETAILPRFKAGDLPGGIKLGADQIIQLLSGNADDLRRTTAPGAVASRPNTDTPIWPILLVVLVGVGLMIYCTVMRGGGLCQAILQLLFLVLLSGRGGGSQGKSSFSGGGGSFGGGGSSGSW